MTRYRKAPVEVEARQLTGDLRDMEIYRWVENNTQGSFDFTGDMVPQNGVSVDPETGILVISTEGAIRWAKTGDWVVKEVEGEFYPCSNERFRNTYEEIIEGGKP